GSPVTLRGELAEPDSPELVDKDAVATLDVQLRRASSIDGVDQCAMQGRAAGIVPVVRIAQPVRTVIAQFRKGIQVTQSTHMQLYLYGMSRDHQVVDM